MSIYETDPLIADEIVAYRDLCHAIRGTLRSALRGNTGHSFYRGCLRALALLDAVSPAGLHSTRGEANGTEVSSH